LPDFFSVKNYYIIRELGSGGAGDVYLAEQKSTKRLVALKVIRTNSALSDNETDSQNRFLDEINAAKRTQSKYIVKILDNGTTDHGLTFVAYEYLSGGDLSTALQDNRKLDYDYCQRALIEPLLKGLIALHKEGVIHRDIKPENLFLSDKGYYKIGDCGLAVFNDRNANTRTGTIVGTPLYLAPERIFSPSILPSPQTDIYSAGLLIIKALSGRFPVIKQNSSNSPLSFIKEITREDIEECNLPAKLNNILYKSVCPLPENRYSSAEAFLSVFPSSMNDKTDNSITKTVTTNDSRTPTKTAFTNDSLTKTAVAGNSCTKTAVAGKVATTLKKEKQKDTLQPKKPATKFPRKKIYLPIMAICLFLIPIYFHYTRSVSTNNLETKNIKWIEENQNKHPLFKEGLKLYKDQWNVENLKNFILVENKAAELSLEKKALTQHIQTLSELKKCVNKSRYIRTLIEYYCLSRAGNRQKAISTLFKLLQIVKQEKPSEKVIQSYTYILTMCLSRLGISTIYDKNFFLQKAIRIGEKFYKKQLSNLNPQSLKNPQSLQNQKLNKTIVSDVIKAINCGNHLLILAKLRLKALKIERTTTIPNPPTGSILDNALELISFIPPYKPHTIFTRDFFNHLNHCLSQKSKTKLNFKDISWEKHRINVKKYTELSLKIRENAKNNYDKYNKYYQTLSQVNSYNKEHSPNLKEYPGNETRPTVATQFLKFVIPYESSAWLSKTLTMIHGSSTLALNEYSVVLIDLCSINKELMKFTKKENTNSQKLTLSALFTYPQVFKETLHILKQQIKTTKSNIEKQGTLYSHLTDIIKYDYIINGNKISKSLQKFLTELKDTAPIAYVALRGLHNKIINVSTPEFEDYTFSIQQLLKPANISFPFSTNNQKPLPDNSIPKICQEDDWYLLLLATFGERWKAGMNNQLFHKQRQLETTIIMSLILKEKHNILERKFIYGKKIFTVAALHRADSSIAINGRLTSEDLSYLCHLPSKGSLYTLNRVKNILRNNSRLSKDDFLGDHCNITATDLTKF